MNKLKRIILSDKTDQYVFIFVFGLMGLTIGGILLTLIYQNFIIPFINYLNF